MIRPDVIMALLTSCIGVLIVAIARLIIDMERSPRTQAEIAATESREAAQRGPSPAPTDSDSDDEGVEADDESGDSTTNKEASVSPDTSTDESPDESEHEASTEDEDGESEETTEGSGDEGSGDSGGDSSLEDSQNKLNQAARISDSSFENIQTPQLNGVPSVSPIPHISGI
jgi:hypothetical protein